MSGTLAELFIAGLVFVASHFLLSSTRLRAVLAGGLGERAFLILYSMLSIVLLGWMIVAYVNAPTLVYWEAGTGVRHLAMTVMLFACLMLVAGVSTPNPTAMGAGAAALNPAGIVKVTRHPVMWAIGLWGLVHMMANGDAASLVFFGWLSLLALLGTVLIDRKRAASMGEAWRPFAEATSNLPLAALASGRARVSVKEVGYARLAIGAALFVILVAFHELLFGAPPLVLP